MQQELLSSSFCLHVINIILFLDAYAEQQHNLLINKHV